LPSKPYCLVSTEAQAITDIPNTSTITGIPNQIFLFTISFSLFWQESFSHTLKFIKPSLKVFLSGGTDAAVPVNFRFYGI
jgi:hypothetical protein